MEGQIVDSILDDARYYLDQAEKNVVEQGGMFVAFAFVRLPGEEQEIHPMFKMPAGMSIKDQIGFIRAATAEAIRALEAKS